ncbi:YkgJ family cysteine cluster protein [Natronococcus sp. JC468]|uniref:YkgJ family cysteine cluster protein n=1 Tax=Natronococcus sp. JC468 TaxID=1961921 RepID=UPI001438FBC3|nr:YkgJ family cysteine cluster protein [Natronococcus sp. JC468]NKE36978.1 YkgJ family cysteine cluster protein [Natronococcus sp. JC468]
MEVHCEGCAGCCLDWRPLLEEGGTDAGDRALGRSIPESGSEAERTPIDDGYNFAALTRDEVRTFLERGAAAALTPRFWEVGEAEGVAVGDRRVAAVAGRPAFFVGLRKPPKPVAPFGREDATWLPTCVFLDPTTLQCRIHGTDRFPDKCGVYPERNLVLGAETECERVESTFGGERLLERDHDDADDLLFGPQAIGAKLFCHPRPDDLEGLLDRLAVDELRPADRAECLAVAVASSPGTLAISEHHYERGYERVIESLEGTRAGDAASDEDAWVGPAIEEWERREASAGGAIPAPSAARTVEEERGAPETPGWDALE